MKIIINSNILWTVTNFRSELIEELKAIGYEVYIVSSVDHFLESTKNDLKKLGVHFYKVTLSRKGINPFTDIYYFYQLFMTYRNIKPDIVLHFTIKPNLYGSFACALLKIPSISTINGLGSGIIGGKFLSKIVRFFYRKAMQYPQKVLFQNSDDRDFFIKNKLVHPKKTDYIAGSGINTQKFNLETKPLGKQRVFLFAGRILKDKGVLEYIDAISIIQKKGLNAKFLLGGIIDHNNPSHISEALISKWEKENIIEYIGKTNDIKTFFQRSDVIVLPSYREGLSRLLLEAASCSKSVITTNVPGCKDIVIDKKTGLICHAKDAKSLANAIEKMIFLDDDLLYEWGQAGRKHIIDNFDSNIINKQYIRVIENFVKNNK